MPVDILINDRPDTERLVIAFTGYGFKLGMPCDAFFKAADLESADRIIITDRSRLMTLNGVDPEFETFEAMVGYLREMVGRKKYRQVLTLGTSGGGHTALLVGHLIRADQSVALVPYTYLSLKTLKRNQDPALKTMGSKAFELDDLSEEAKQYFDLDTVLRDWNGTTQFFIHVGRFHELDWRRAQHLAAMPRLTIIPHPYDSHAITSLLDKEGVLKVCFRFPFHQSRWWLIQQKRRLRNRLRRPRGLVNRCLLKLKRVANP
jgi:hypothetical protein